MSLGAFGARGPSGAAPRPPDWLNSIDLPLEIIPAGTPLIRVHRLTHHPIFFGPGAGIPPTYRFDSLRGEFCVLYVGLSLTAALAETLLRNPTRRMIAYGALAARASSELRSGRDLRVVRMHGTGLQRVGCDNAISTGPYEPCGAWADALWHHPDKPDGIAYQSRQPREADPSTELTTRPEAQGPAAGTAPAVEAPILPCFQQRHCRYLNNRPVRQQIMP